MDDQEVAGSATGRTACSVVTLVDRNQTSSTVTLSPATPAQRLSSVDRSRPVQQGDTW
jgi:hypothetical protein